MTCGLFRASKCGPGVRDDGLGLPNSRTDFGAERLLSCLKFDCSALSPCILLLLEEILHHLKSLKS